MIHYTLLFDVVPYFFPERDFYFLRKMTKLSSLICDHNMIYSDVELPYLPNLELCWMNHCDVSIVFTFKHVVMFCYNSFIFQLKELLPFCKTLQNSFPNLKYLSLMGNRAVPSVLRGDRIYECQQYR